MTILHTQEVRRSSPSASMSAVACGVGKSPAGMISYTDLVPKPAPAGIESGIGPEIEAAEAGCSARYDLWDYLWDTA